MAENIVKWVKICVKAVFPKKILLLYRLYKVRKKSHERLKKREKLHLSIHLTDHCNLNCKGCDNFSCIADEKYHSVQSLENDFKRIYELAEGRINSISLLGGEPLLHPELISIMNNAGKYFSGASLSLVTNGILLLKQDKIFWETCRKNNIKVTITKYPINLPFDEITKKAKNYGAILQYKGDTEILTRQMHKIPINLNGTENNQNSFEMCYKSNTCITLDEGKIYTCATIPYIKYFNKYFGMDMKVSENDYIDIYSVKNAEEIFDFLCKPMPFCRYCKTKEPVYDIKWEVTKKQLSEWV